MYWCYSVLIVFCICFFLSLNYSQYKSLWLSAKTPQPVHRQMLPVCSSAKRSASSRSYLHTQLLLGYLQALQWIADNVQHPAVVSASIAGEHSPIVNQAVQSLISDVGVTFVTAAGGAYSKSSICLQQGVGLPDSICSCYC